MSPASNTLPQDFFNDLSRRTARSAQQNRSPVMSIMGDDVSAGDLSAPKPKRIACIICRKRKLKCDGLKPSCSTCTRLGHNCSYDEVRRKSGPKRGYVKALEERLKQVETLLKTQDSSTKAPESTPVNFPNGQANVSSAGFQSVPAADFNISNPTMGIATGINAESWRYNGDSPNDLGFNPNLGMDMGMAMTDNTFTWEMIGLCLEEPLPPQESIDELQHIYFEKIHPSLPMIHKYRFLAAMNLAPNQRPPVALRYALWCLAASVVDKYIDLKDLFYQRSRKYIELDTLKGHGEHMISIAHAQTHILLSSYEFKMMYFPRAWMSTGAAIRLCQMMGLHRLDGAGLDVKQCLPPPRDWTEREERRRTFWMAFCEDRYASIGTGWPMTIDECDVLTNLPASDEAFELSKPEDTQSLSDSLNLSGAANLSAFAGVVLMACLFGRNLIHLHRPDADDRDHDLNGEFWRRHRHMDNLLLNTSLSMSSHLKLPNGISNPNIVFTNMNIHTSTICLHQAAIYKASKHQLPSSVGIESKMRCISAANEIAGIMRMISHLELSSMNPFISFCLYVAARVFVQYLKSRPDESQTGDSLRFLLAAMNALKKKNPLTESFLVQLDVDLEGLGMRDSKPKSAWERDPENRNSGSSIMPPVRPIECNYMVITGDEREDVNSRGAQNSRNEIGRDASPSQTQTSTILNSNFNQTDWVSVAEHGHRRREQEVQHTMPGLVLGQMPQASFSGDISKSGYDNSESSAGADVGRSPNTLASNRPASNATTPSEPRSANLQPGHKGSGATSYETSPSSTHNAGPKPPEQQRLMSAFFSTQPDYTTIPATGLTPHTGYTMSETPVPNGWGMSGQQSTGLTPVGDGTLRHLMGMGPMDPMDIWQGGTGN